MGVEIREGIKAVDDKIADLVSRDLFGDDTEIVELNEKKQQLEVELVCSESWKK